MDEQKLSSLKEDWREEMTDSITKVLEAIAEEMPESAAKHNELLALKLRLNEANKQKIMRTLSAEQLNVLYNALRYDILMFIDELSPEDFEPAPIVFGQGQPPPQTGTLLHKIPRQMAVDKEEECIIRLAFERAVIADNLDLTDEVEVKDIVVSKVMQAELIDPNASPAFAIRTFSDEEQFLQTGSYTEWKFLVTPLREGAFKLLLKISVVEIIEGKERMRNISFEEMIQIVSAAAKVPEAAFTNTGIQVAHRAAKSFPEDTFGDVTPKGTPMTEIGGSDFDLEKIKEFMNVETERAILPQEPAPVKPPKPQGRSRRFSVLSVAASLLVVVGTIAFLGLPMLTGSEEAKPGAGEVTPVEQLDKKDDAPEPVSKPKELDTWKEAQQKNTITAYQDFINKYPKSDKVAEAKKRMKALVKSQ